MNEALRKVEEETTANMSKLTGGMGGLGGGFPFMMDYYSSQISKLIEELGRLPGIGAKSAQRLAFHIIRMPEEQVKQLAGVLVEARKNVRYCSQCCTLTDQEVCPDLLQPPPGPTA